jgi:2-polyprenyl-6-methoxyphenol hydroxylase-like FAD-dependent oxidoreductase
LSAQTFDRPERGRVKATKHVLISGAGIAGPTLAFWLHHFGFRVTIVERWAGIRPGGHTVDVRGAAKEVLHRMSLNGQVRAACTGTRGLSYVTRNNRTVVSLRSDQFDGDGRIAEIEILRGDLAEVFHTATKDITEYLFDARIASVSQDATGIVVCLTTGAQRRFDLVIGADGLHSGVRALMFGPESEFLHHLGHYVAFFTVPNRIGLDRWALCYQEPGRRAGIRGGDPKRNAVGLLGFRSPKLDCDYNDLKAQKALLRERFTKMAWHTPWLLEQLDTAPDFFFDSCAQVEMTSWSRGRVALVGDAAYCPSPLSGQGTSLAIVGAYVLAGELAAARGDHTIAFPAYQSRLRDFVSINQKIGRDNAITQAPTSYAGIAWEYLTSSAKQHLSHLTHGPMRPVTGVEFPNYADPA